MVPRGAMDGAGGVTVTPGPTVTLAAATLPSPSVTVTTSVTPAATPATYTPLPELIVPPEALALMAKMKPAPLPAKALHVSVRGRGGSVARAVREALARTTRWAVAELPTDSVTLIVSVTLSFWPAT